MPPRLKITPVALTENVSKLHIQFSSLPMRTFSNSCKSQTWYADAYTRRQQLLHATAKAARGKKSAKKAAVVEEPGANPVRGLTTPFVKSFDNPSELSKIEFIQASPDAEATLQPQPILNYRVGTSQLKDQLEHSKFLADPTGRYDPSSASSEDKRAELEEDAKKAHEEHAAGHVVALEAMNRIMKIDMGSSKDRYRINVDRCIELFGRHNTDSTLPGKDGKPQKEKQRIGPDVGSSEVQIAVLTAKIRNLANGIDATGKKDHHNKRNLRLLVHQRQKLLKYLRKRERGGPRWQHVIQTLGLTEATWKGEIVV